MLNITKSIKLFPFSIEQANNFFNLIDKNRSFLRKRLFWLDNIASCKVAKKCDFKYTKTLKDDDFMAYLMI